jgi:hypothetical protein
MRAVPTLLRAQTSDRKSLNLTLFHSLAGGGAVADGERSERLKGKYQHPQPDPLFSFFQLSCGVPPDSTKTPVSAERKNQQSAA